MKTEEQNYALYTATAWRTGLAPLSFHPTEAQAWSEAVRLVDASPSKPVFSRWCHAHAGYRVVCQSQSAMEGAKV